MIIDNKRLKVLKLNFQGIIERIRSNNRLRYNEFILCRSSSKLFCVKFKQLRNYFFNKNSLDNIIKLFNICYNNKK